MVKKIAQFFRMTSAAILVAIAVNACSDLEQPLPTNQKPELSVHPAGWVNLDSSNFHGNFIRDHGWNLGDCQECHGQNYAGGIAEVSCLTCHPKTPEDCVVCHGGVDNQTGAPPRDLNGDVAVSAPGVGAHTVHLEGGDFNAGFACGTCHVVPDSFKAPGHIEDNLPARVIFADLALVDGANPVWDLDELTCQNAYCHGAWSLPKAQSTHSFVYTADEITGNDSSPIWNEPSTVACGTCHGLPPTGHTTFALTACMNCHSSVVNGEGQIIDKSKHVNGMVNVFGEEYPMF